MPMQTTAEFLRVHEQVMGLNVTFDGRIWRWSDICQRQQGSNACVQQG